MVGIVAVTRFCEAGSSAFASYINYIDRGSAVRKENIGKYNIFSEYMDYMDDDEKGASGTERVSALFTKDKDSLTKEEKASVKECFKTAQTNGSNMWQTVISFDNAYLEELGIYDYDTDTLNEKLLMQASRKAISDMLRSEGLDNATWTAAFHYNTDNIHIHIATVEPEPMREKKTYYKYERDENGNYPKDDKGRPVKMPQLDRSGEPITYEAYKGTFSKKSIEALKSGLRNELEGAKEAHKKITRLLRENILADKKEKSLLDTPEFTDKMLSLYEDLSESGIPVKSWHYNMNVMAGHKAKIDDLSDYFIQAYHQGDFAQFVAHIEAEAAKQTKAYGGRGSDYVNNMLYGKEGLYARLGNAILKEIKAYDKEIKSQRSEVRSAMRMLDPEHNSYNPEKGLELLRGQAERGNTYAQNSLGVMHMQGRHVERSTEKARAYFKSSAAKGNAFGKEMLGKLDSKKGVAGMIKGRRLLSSLPRADIRRGLKALEHNLKHNYMRARNLAEHEELERKIKERGEEEAEV